MSAGPGAGSATSRTPRLSPALVVMGIVAVLAVVAAGTSGGWTLEQRIWFGDGVLVGTPATPPPVAEPGEPPPMIAAGPVQRWIGAVLAGLLGLAVLAALFYLGRWLWRRRPRRAVVVEEKPNTTPAGALAQAPDLPALLRGAETAETILTETGGVPRDLVLRCWLALEEAAAASGAARRPADSPTEFTGAVLRATHADQHAVDTLLHLYHQARFSRHPITDDDVRTARTAVVRLAATWRGFDTAVRHTTRPDP